MNEQRDAAAVRIFPPAVPVLTILLGAGLNHIWPIHFGFKITSTECYWLGGAILMGAIFGLGLWSVLLIRWSGQRENPWKPTTQIIDRRPFTFTRNPMYLQLVLVCVGIAVIFANWWVLALTPIGVWLLQRFAILPEEAYLERKFGDTYLAYKRRVRRWV
jgi:protein-S-isoprenylcysteine O-methyltransferase Ste14